MKPELQVTFTWDNVAGIFHGRLANGACFTIDRSHIGGKLENALTLFRNACVAVENGGYVVGKRTGSPIGDDIRKTIELSYDETKVRRFRQNGKPVLDLDIELDDLELDL